VHSNNKDISASINNYAGFSSSGNNNNNDYSPEEEKYSPYLNLPPGGSFQH